MGVALLSQVSPPSSDPSTRHLLLDKFEVKSLNFVLIDLSPAARPLGQRHSLAPDRLHQLPATPTSSLATAIPAPAPRSASVAYTSPRHLVPLYRATPLHFYIPSCPPSRSSRSDLLAFQDSSPPGEVLAQSTDDHTFLAACTGPFDPSCLPCEPCPLLSLSRQSARTKRTKRERTSPLPVAVTVAWKRESRLLDELLRSTSVAQVALSA